MHKSSFYIRRQRLKKSSILPLLLSFLLGLGTGMGGFYAWSNWQSRGQIQAAAETQTDDSASSQTEGHAEANGAEAAEPTPEKVFYTVQAGDTLSKIAGKFETSMDSLLLLNNLQDANTIIVGQKLLVLDVLPSLLFGRLTNNTLQLIQTNSVDRGETILMSAKVFDANPTVALSPDGQHILYTEKPIASSEGTITWASRLDGSERVSLIPAELRLSQALGQLWSPKNDAILYAFEQNLWLVKLDGSAPTLVTSSLPTDYETLMPYAFSPDGSEIAMIKSEDGKRLIEKYSIERRDFELIKADAEHFFTELYWPVAGRLYLVGAPSATPSVEKIEVYRIGTSLGANLLPVTENTLPERHLIFLPESETFAFAVGGLASSDRAAEQGVWMVEQSEQGQTQLYKSSGSGALPLRFVGADETQSLYVTDEENQLRSLYQVNLATQRMSRIAGGRDLVFF